MTTTAATKVDRISNRAPRGGAISSLNGRFYAGGQFMPTLVPHMTVKPAPLAGSTRQVAWANRLRAAALANLDDEIHARRMFLASPKKSESARYRPIVKKLLVARFNLMSERSAAAVIDRRAELV